MPDGQPPVPSSELQSFKFNVQVMATEFLCFHERDINSLPSRKAQLVMHLVLNLFCLDARCRPPTGFFFFCLSGNARLRHPAHGDDMGLWFQAKRSKCFTPWELPEGCRI